MPFTRYPIGILSSIEEAAGNWLVLDQSLCPLWQQRAENSCQYENAFSVLRIWPRSNIPREADLSGRSVVRSAFSATRTLAGPYLPCEIGKSGGDW